LVTFLSLYINLQSDDEQQRMLINILKQRYSRQHAPSSSAVSTPMMVNQRNKLID